jgi:hypothetical protein
MLVAMQARRHREECATYESFVSVLLFLSASASDTTPALHAQVCQRRMFGDVSSVSSGFSRAASGAGSGE